MPFNPIRPDANLYGVIPQLYAASLGRSTGDPGADAINAINLGNKARSDPGTGEYGALISEANKYGYDAALAEEQGKLDAAYLAQAPALLKQGAAGAFTTGPYSGIIRDNKAVAMADLAGRRGLQAEAYQKAMAGAKDSAEAGITPNTDVLSGIITPPESDIPAPFATGYISPNIQANITKAQADMISANAAKQRAANGEGKPPSQEDTTQEVQVWNPKTQRYETISRTVTNKTKGPQHHQGATPSPGLVVPKTIIDSTGHVVPNPAYKGP